MRLALSVIALLLAAYFALTLTKKQAEVLVAQPPRASAPAAAGGASATPLPQQVQQDVQKALEQGMQQRASTPGL